MPSIAVTDTSFDEEVLAASGPILVDLWAPWCGPCQQLGPVLENLSDELAGKVVVAKVDIDANPELARRLSVRSIPALVLFNGGEVVAARLGALSKSQLTDWLAENGVAT